MKQPHLPHAVAALLALGPLSFLLASPAGAAEQLVPIPIQLPKRMFEGTPQNLAVPNVQKPLGRPRDPFLAPASAKLPKPKGFRPLSLLDALEAASWLERVDVRRRGQLCDWILERTWTDRDPRLWAALGRLGTRVPVFMPMRVTQELCDMLAKYHPLWVNIHVNHSNEISLELEQACDRLSRAGIPLGNQSVLLAGVNDNVHIQRKLVQDLVRIRVRPYYLYQCDLVEGAGHFRTPVAKGIEIMEGLRGHTSGYAVPQYIVDAPGGGGKIPVMPNYLLSMSDHKVILRNYEGYVAAYEEPTDYLPSEAAKFKGEKRPEPGQTGIHGLLEGDQMFIKPEGFDETHDRHGIQHRLKDDKKWQPLGIGAGSTKSDEE